MKKTILILVLLTFSFSFAQVDGRMKERIKAQKATFITNALDLTSQEAQQFWPIYNTYDDTIEAIRTGKLRKIREQMRRNPNVSETEANTALSKIMEAETEMFNAKIKLVNDLKGVIPSVKILKLKAAEDEFNRKLLERLKEFRQKRKFRD